MALGRSVTFMGRVPSPTRPGRSHMGRVPSPKSRVAQPSSTEANDDFGTRENRLSMDRLLVFKEKIYLIT